MAKENYIRLRCTEEFKKQVEELARKENRTVSNYIENLLQEKLGNARGSTKNIHSKENNIMETFYTGGEEYCIAFKNGNHIIAKIDIEKNEIVFKGNYERCLNKMNEIIEDNYEYDMNL